MYTVYSIVYKVYIGGWVSSILSKYCYFFEIKKKKPRLLKKKKKNRCHYTFDIQCEDKELGVWI